MFLFSRLTRTTCTPAHRQTPVKSFKFRFISEWGEYMTSVTMTDHGCGCRMGWFEYYRCRVFHGQALQFTHNNRKNKRCGKWKCLLDEGGDERIATTSSWHKSLSSLKYHSVQVWGAEKHLWTHWTLRRIGYMSRRPYQVSLLSTCIGIGYGRHRLTKIGHLKFGGGKKALWYFYIFQLCSFIKLVENWLLELLKRSCQHETELLFTQ